LPAGRHVDLAPGKTCFVREVSADTVESGRPPLLLLHGWVASGGLNWLRAFDSLSQHYRVLAPDFRGHAQGEACRTKFSIEDCADDMGALLEVLSPGEPAIVVGYSMGGMVAQELWRRHRSRVGGLVLSATSCAPVPVSRGRDSFTRAMSSARSTLRRASRSLNAPLRFSSRMDENVARAFGKAFESKLFSSSATLQGMKSKGIPGASGTTNADSDSGQTDALRTWAREEFARHHWPTILDAGRAIAEFDTRSWIRGVDVPTTVMLTKRDRLVSPAQQQDMADRIPGARIESVDAGHFACVREDFGPRILRSARRVERALA